ncbi:hypothetical protein [Pigmentiphaga sp.]|uniref:hypothetical protein n=1 Tax=Pigmentiphaga sp. TaxID=1977564 RepID=UPI0025DFD3E4|nr:hypothetical protein [Pigmentiphaga sp.]
MISGAVGSTRVPYSTEIGDAGEIHSAADTLQVARTRPALRAAEEALSLPPQAFTPDPTLQLLNRMLGAALSTDSLAWRGNPIPAMRGLQKLLVAHSLDLPEESRGPSMRAIRAVELAVRWRLRWMQMKRSDAESQTIQPQQDEHATKAAG